MLSKQHVLLICLYLNVIPSPQIDHKLSQNDVVLINLGSLSSSGPFPILTIRTDRVSKHYSA